IGTLFLSFALSFVSCSDDYDDQIDDLNNEINSLKSLLGSSTNKLVANVSVNGSVITVSYTDGSSDTLDTKGDVEEYSLKIVDGILQLVTDGSGSGSVTLPVPVVELPEYTIQLDGNQLTLLKDGVPAGQVTLPETDDSGSGPVIDLPTAADFTVEDGYLCYKGDPTGVYLLGSDATAPELKIVPEDGKYVIYQDGVAIDGFIPMVEILDGKLTVMGEELDINALLPQDASVVIYQLDDEGNVVGVSIKVGDETITLPIARALEGLIFIPDLYVDGVGTVKYNILKVDGEVKMSSTSTLKFRTNPSSADVSGFDWIFLNRAVEFGTRAEGNDELIKIIGEVEQSLSPYSSISIQTKGRFENSRADTTKNIYDVVNLKATGSSSKTLAGDVVSDDVQVLFYTYNNVEIANKQKTDTIEVANHYVFPTSEVGYRACTPQFTIDVKGDQTFDLMDYVSAVLDKNDLYTRLDYEYGGANSEWDLVELDTLGFTDYAWTFKSVSFVPDDSNDTDQAYYVELEKDGTKVTVKGNSAYEDRTPVFEANLLDENGEVMATHYIKFLLKKGTPTEPVEGYEVNLGNIDYLDLYIDSVFTVDWMEVSDKIYEGLGMSHDQFVNAYVTNAADDPSVEYVEVPKPNEYYKYTDVYIDSLGYVSLSTGDASTSTTLLEVTISPRASFGEHTWEVVLKSTISSQDIKLTVKFTLTAPTHPELERSYVDVNGDVATVNGQIKNDQFTFDAVMAESFEATPWEEFNNNVAPYADNVMCYNDNNGGTEFTSAANGESTLTGTISNTGDHNTQEITTSKIDIAERRYNVVFRSEFENKGRLETPWVYRFVNPLDVKLEECCLNTYSNGDPGKQEIYELLTVTVLKDAIYTNGTKDSVNYSKYGINGETWSINYNNSNVATGDKLYLDEADTLVWNNSGTRLLQNNTDAKLEVTVDTDYATATQSATITLLKTEDEGED
ncbi:MAG: hypothetical protein LUE98_10660, partial [Tannerellaceae bacterium]|nr:hypothetical protein [Tannerellaceae bacterium]